MLNIKAEQTPSIDHTLGVCSGIIIIIIILLLLLLLLQ